MQSDYGYPGPARTAYNDIAVKIEGQASPNPYGPDSQHISMAPTATARATPVHMKNEFNAWSYTQKADAPTIHLVEETESRLVQYTALYKQVYTVAGRPRVLDREGHVS